MQEAVLWAWCLPLPIVDLLLHDNIEGRRPIGRHPAESGPDRATVVVEPVCIPSEDSMGVTRGSAESLEPIKCWIESVWNKATNIPEDSVFDACGLTPSVPRAYVGR